VISFKKTISSIVRFPRLLRTPFGRRDVSHKFFNLFYFILRPSVGIYRRTVLRNTRVITVIGSLGKTTTCRTLADVVGDTRLKGDGNYKISVIKNLLKHTPSSRYAVMETAVGGPGYMEGYARMLKPDIAVVTSIASEHILSFGSLEETRHEKSKMLRSLPPEKNVILNADDPNVMWMAGQTDARIITYGMNKNADIRAENIRIIPPGGMEFDAVLDENRLHLRISLLGRHMVYPALASLAIADLEGLDLQNACRTIEDVQPVQGRMCGVILPSGAVLVRDDYKATRESVWRALETIREYPARRKILVLGGVSEIFNEERYEFYRDLGSRIASSVDLAYLFMQKNTFRRCRIGAENEGMDRSSITRIRFDALSISSLLPEDLGEGDVILIKGRTDYKIARLSLALMGRNVNCRLMSCPITTSFCDNCSMLEKGWNREKEPPLKRR